MAGEGNTLIWQHEGTGADVWLKSLPRAIGNQQGQSKLPKTRRPSRQKELCPAHFNDTEFFRIFHGC